LGKNLILAFITLTPPDHATILTPETVTNWQTVRYALTNQFYQRADSYVTAAVRIHEETKPIQP
jgi:hypothetical protein